MFILMSIHHPKPEYEAKLIDSMHRYQNAIKGQPGLIRIHTLKDELSPRLVGLAMFQSKADFERLAPVARAAVKDDPFEAWEAVPIEGLKLVEV